MTLNRDQEEILFRINSLKGEDMFGFRQEVLGMFLVYDHIIRWAPGIAKDVGLQQWADSCSRDPFLESRNYLEFAFSKAADHRGISAIRSVEKLYEYAWLMGRDDVCVAMEAAPYGKYGVPKLVAFAKGIGVSWPEDNAALVRMSEGWPCRPDCEEGCFL